MIQAAPDSVGINLLGLVLHAHVETRVVLVLCALFSIASWYLIGAKWWEFRQLRHTRRAYDKAVERSRSLEEREQAVTALGDSPFAEIVRITGTFFGDIRRSMDRDGVSRSGLSLTQLEALSLSLDAGVREEMEGISRGLPWLATIAATAPLLGLFGTVLGIMRAFIGIGNTNSSNLAAVAPGIAEALIATAFGLGAAIPAVMAYNIFTSRAEVVQDELERLAQELIGALGREGRI